MRRVSSVKTKKKKRKKEEEEEEEKCARARVCVCVRAPCMRACLRVCADESKGIARTRRSLG